MQAHIVQADGHVAPAARDHRRDVDRLVLSEAPELLVGSKPHLVALAVLRVVLQPLHERKAVLRAIFRVVRLCGLSGAEAPT